MRSTESDGKLRASGWWRFSVMGVLLLGLSTGLLAEIELTAKGLYYGGLGIEFKFRNVNGQTDLSVEARYWSTHDNDWDIQWSEDWGRDASQHITGDLGACVFDGLLYCFFTTTDGKLQYVTVDPASHHKTGPTTITTGISPHGAAAAVCRDVVYVFTCDRAFKSTDGSQFSVWHLSSGLPATRMLDAITFFPGGDDSAAVMVLYNDTGSPPDLSFSYIFPPDTLLYGDMLPWPPVNPYLWAPVTQGELVLGTSAHYGGAGAKEPCVQFYGMTASGQDGQHLGRWEYTPKNYTWTFHNWTHDTQGGNLYQLCVFPWFDTIDSTKGVMRLSHILDVQFEDTEKWYANRSDWMVPQHSDNNWMGKETVTSTATSDSSDDKKLRALWSLVGVVLGPPPFALNGADNADGLSNVQYGIDRSHSIETEQTTTQTLSVAMDNKISAGFGEFNLDLSYAHAWTHSHGATHTVDVSTYYTFGPDSETPPNQGIHGWAIFNAPTLLTQQYKVYAYDYDHSTGSGTYLDQDVYATSIGEVVSQMAYFELQTPSNGTIQDLFDGMQIYPDSTDIEGWYHIKDWNSGGSDWAAIFGDRSSPAVGTLSVGAEITQEYTQTDSVQDTHGNTNSFSVEAGASFDLFEGFESGVTVGYEAEFETSTTLESTITHDVSCTLDMPIPPNTPGYVKAMTIQPYWLQAKTNKAPWIPAGYIGNLPWCITWDIFSYSKVSGETVGASPPPVSAHGRASDGKGKKDTYTIETGWMVFLDEYGFEEPLDMTADDFDSNLGARVVLNGYAFPADGSKGKWSRNGDLWKYKTRDGVKNDPFVLKLDFASKSWSFDCRTKHLDRNVKIADGALLVELEIQGLHRFTRWVNHDVDADWYHKENPAHWEPTGVHKFKGAYDSATGSGWAVLKGHFPKEAEGWGDMEIVVNGGSTKIPLLSLDGFLEDVEAGRTVTYQADGLLFEIDFSKGRWKATIEDGAFQEAMAPQGGTAEIRILLGGEVVSDQTLVIEKHLSKLSYGG